MMDKIITLEKFYESDYPDGHYAVWKSGKIQHEDSFIYGFSGTVVEYTEYDGFKQYPDWMDETNESEIKILLLEKLPNIEQLKNMNKIV
jgi:hypothetical protein